jgi:Ubiquitin-activating enzyme E1 FCCH domain
MFILNDIITYIRRIVKTPNNSVLTDNLIIDYINRFWISDIDARIQLFDFKTKYQFQTTPGIDQYNMPLYSVQVSPNPAQPTSNIIASYPVYQGFTGNCKANGIQLGFSTQMRSFDNLWPNYVQQQIQVGTGNGGTNYNLNLPFFPAIPGHVDMAGVISSVTPPSSPQDPILGTTLNLNVPTTSVYSAVYFTATGYNGQNIVVADSGQFLSNNIDGNLYGLLMYPGNAPLGNQQPTNGYENSFSITGATQASQAVLTITSNFEIGQTIQIKGVSGMTELNNRTFTVVSNSGTTLTIDVDSTSFTNYISGGTATSFSNIINYNTGVAKNVNFPSPIPDGTPINAQCYFIEQGMPRSILYFNNIISMTPPPDSQYLIEMEAYLTPAAFLSTSQAIPFAYMTEYISRGAAQKILSDTMDTEQYMFYQPIFLEQESLVWKRSQRQFTSTRTETIYSNNHSLSNNNYNNSSGV